MKLFKPKTQEKISSYWKKGKKFASEVGKEVLRTSRAIHSFSSPVAQATTSAFRVHQPREEYLDYSIRTMPRKIKKDPFKGVAGF